MKNFRTAYALLIWIVTCSSIVNSASPSVIAAKKQHSRSLTPFSRSYDLGPSDDDKSLLATSSLSRQRALRARVELVDYHASKSSRIHKPSPLSPLRDSKGDIKPSISKESKYDSKKIEAPLSLFTPIALTTSPENVKEFNRFLHEIILKLDAYITSDFRKDNFEKFFKYVISCFLNDCVKHNKIFSQPYPTITKYLAINQIGLDQLKKVEKLQSITNIFAANIEVQKDFVHYYIKNKDTLLKPRLRSAKFQQQLRKSNLVTYEELISLIIHCLIVPFSEDKIGQQCEKALAKHIDKVQELYENILCELSLRKPDATFTGKTKKDPLYKPITEIAMYLRYPDKKDPVAWYNKLYKRYEQQQKTTKIKKESENTKVLILAPLTPSRPILKEEPTATPGSRPTSPPRPATTILKRLIGSISRWRKS